jgi:hypothetical protein
MINLSGKLNRQSHGWIARAFSLILVRLLTITNIRKKWAIMIRIEKLRVSSLF